MSGDEDVGVHSLSLDSLCLTDCDPHEVLLEDEDDTEPDAQGKNRINTRSESTALRVRAENLRWGPVQEMH